MASVFTTCGIVLGACAIVSASHAGVVVGSGSVSLWGRSTPYTSWDVLFDPLPGLIDPAEGRVRDFGFYNGRLYCTSTHELGNGGPWYYTPGAAGSLATPIQPVLPFPPQTPWRFFGSGSLAINPSGQGFGAFSGTDPVLVSIGATIGGGPQPLLYTLTQSGSNYTVGPSFNFPSPQGFRPRGFEYVSALDRFVGVELNQGNPGQSILNFHPHHAGGILPPDSSVTLNVLGIRGITPVSAEFASLLSGLSITQPALLAMQKDDIGLSDPPRLYLLTLNGSVITQTNFNIPGWINPQAIAVDEANSVIYTSDRELGQIHVMRVPAIGAGWSLLLTAFGFGTISRRRT